MVPATSSGLVERTTPSTRSGSGAVATSSVGRLGPWTIPSTVVAVPLSNCEVGRRPTVRSVPGPSKWSASNRRSVRRPAAPASAAKRSRQAADGIRLVEPAHVRDLLPELRERRVRGELGVRRGRPGGRRVRDDGPVRRPRVDHREVLLQRGHQVLARARRIEPGEAAGLHRGMEHDPRAVLVAERQLALGPPRGHELERVLGGVLDPDPLDLGVEVDRVDEAGAAAVRVLGDRTHERGGLDPRHHRDDLPRLHVRAGLDGERREAVDQLRVHAPQAIRPREPLGSRAHGFL